MKQVGCHKESVQSWLKTINATGNLAAFFFISILFVDGAEKKA